jgi:UV DNA damage endonuclease
MRISSEMFPFASHAELGYTLEFAKQELSAAGRVAMKYGHRLTMHPVPRSPCCLIVGTIHANRIA